MDSTVNGCLIIVSGLLAVVLTLSNPSRGTKWKCGVSKGIPCGLHQIRAQRFHEASRSIATLLNYIMCRAIVTTFGGIMQTQFVTSRIFIKCPSPLKSSEAAISVDFPHNSWSLSSVCFVKLLNRRLCYFSATGNSRRPDAVYSKLFLFLGLNILFIVGASLH